MVVPLPQPGPHDGWTDAAGTLHVTQLSSGSSRGLQARRPVGRAVARAGAAVCTIALLVTTTAAAVSLSGGEHVDVVADYPSGGTASFDLPVLPVPDGNVLLQQVHDRMHQLRTFRIDETLTPAAVPIQTLYAFQAPDRMQMDIS